ncbi:ParA family protein [Salisaeta longa]|uniref:ParA family protein n=1 Tax=Salisaeta longa TaxID=503170 RepID=UPI0003B6BDD4|nr:ParA family protein [Salisaeta longa]
MKVLTICNHKGGTGKTTTAIHLSAAFGLSGRRTLVLDLDPQGFLSRALHVGEPPPEESVLALFDTDLDIRRIQARSLSGFDLIPSSGRLTKQMRSLNKPTDVFWVRETLDQLTLNYDMVVFDTAAAVTVYSLNALVASDYAVIPVLPEYQGIIGAEQTYQTVNLVRKRLNPSLAPPLFLFTQVDARKRIHHTYQQYVRRKYGDQVLEQVIRTSTSLAVAHEEGKTVFNHDATARGARDYANAADELLRHVTGGAEASSDDETSNDASTSSNAPPPASSDGASNDPSTLSVKSS